VRSLNSLLLGGAVLFFAAGPATAVTYIVGQADAFASPVEPLSPSPELDAVLVPYGGTNDLDQTLGINDGQGNAQVAHTFTNLPPQILGARLRVSLRAGIGETETDGIFLSFVDWAGSDYKYAVRYARSFAPVVAHPPLYAFDDPGVVGPTWEQGNTAVLELNLGNLPLAQGGVMSLIQDLNWRRFLDVNVGDETAVDYMLLDLTLPDRGGKGGKRVGVLATPNILATTQNPVRGAARVDFALPEAGDVTLRVFDVSGRNVASILRSGLSAGTHSLEWNTRDANGRSVPAGVYFYRVESVGASKTFKLTVLR
jgi:hypothetical protein